MELTQQDEQVNIDDLMTDIESIMGLSDMPEEERDEILSMMIDTVIQNALLSTAEVLIDEDRDMMYRQAQALSLPAFLDWLGNEHTIFFTAMIAEFQGFLMRLQQDLAEME